MTALARCPTTSTMSPPQRSSSRRPAIRKASISANYIVVAANPLDVACAQILQQQWQAAGIKVKIEADGDRAAPQHVELRDLADAALRRAFLDARRGRDPPVHEVRQQVRHGHGHERPRPRHDDRSRLAPTSTSQARAAKNLAIQKHIAEKAYVIQIYQYPLRWEIWWNYVEGLRAACREHPLLRPHDVGDEIGARAAGTKAGFAIDDACRPHPSRLDAGDPAGRLIRCLHADARAARRFRRRCGRLAERRARSPRRHPARPRARPAAPGAISRSGSAMRSAAISAPPS